MIEWVVAAMLLAAGVEDGYPVMAEVKTFAARGLDAKTLEAMRADAMTRDAAIRKLGGAKLVKTDTGYGAHYRIRYTAAQGTVEIYSGVFDGSRVDVSFYRPIPLEYALETAKRMVGPEPRVDFTKPSAKGPRFVDYESKGSGCLQHVHFELGGKGVQTFTFGIGC